MLRILGTVIAIFSTATLLTLSLVLAYTWGQGNLTDESGKEILAILKGEPRPSELNREDEPEQMASFQQLEKQRVERILGISARESELSVLKQAIDDQTRFVLNERRQLEQLKKAFREELQSERDNLIAEATAQARGILLKMDPESAVEKLLSLPTEDAVILIKGMPEKEAAKILDQFRQRIAGKDPNMRVEKAEEIYKAIYRGDPLIQPVENARQAVREAGPEKNDTR
ncbi:MAG: hypothetical protein R3C12_11275 [Planctomycetaceae bacterium]|nr:hypothetical protein [Planctomycetaceae bacterium]